MNDKLNTFLIELDNQKSFAARVRYADQHFNRLGSGSGRIVYDVDDNYVLKLAKNNKGIAQNREEKSICAYNDYDDILANVIDSSDNDVWILSEKAKKINKRRFKTLTGFELIDVYYYLRNFIDENNGRKSLFNIDDEVKYQLDNDDFINRLKALIMDYSLSAGDMGRPSTFGEINRDGKPTVVLTDYGLSDEVYNTYYKPKTNNVGIYEIFDFAHGNTDHLSDIEDTSDIRGGMWALPIHGVGDNVMNEEFVNYINNRKEYPKQPITSLPELLDIFYSCVGALSNILKSNNNDSNFIRNLLELQKYLYENGFLDNTVIGLNEEGDVQVGNDGYPIVDRFGDGLRNEDYARELVKNSLDKLGYSTSVELLGGGGYGFAYELDNKHVFKITTDVSEVDAAFKIMRGNPKYIAKIYKVYKIIDDNTNQAFFGLFVENIKYKPVELFREYNRIINTILPDVDFFRIMKKRDFNYNDAVKIAERILTDRPELNISEKDRKEAYDFQIGLFNIRKELMELNIKSKDYVEVKNLGYKDNVLKYFDVGGYSSKESDFGDVDKILLPEVDGIKLVNKEQINNLIKKVAKKLNISEFKYIGSGHNGVAYDIGNNRVLKITHDRSEAMMNMKLMGKDLKYIANTYNVYKINNINNDDLYVILLEKLKTNPDYFDRMNNRLNKVFDLLFNMDMVDVFEHILYGHLFDDSFNLNQLKNYFKKNDEDKRYFNALINISKELEKYDLDSIDYLKPDNLGYKKNGNIGFFDVGFGDLNYDEELSVLDIDEDGTSKFSTDSSIGVDVVSSYNQYDSSPPVDNNLNANSSLYKEDLEYSRVSDATNDEYVMNERKKDWMPNSRAVKVKQRCRIGGKGDGTSDACNQGDINNLEFTSINEEIDAEEVYNGGELDMMINGKKDVSLISFRYNPKLKQKAIDLNFGLLPIKQDSHDVDMNIIYRKNNKGINNSIKLFNIMKNKGGYVSDKSPKEAYEIGKLLDYSNESILKYINKNYKKTPNGGYRETTIKEKKEFDAKNGINSNNVSEGVGDEYLKKKHHIASEFDDFDTIYNKIKNRENKEDIIYEHNGLTIIKNPKNLNNLGSGVRGVVDIDGNIYVGNKINTLHEELLKILDRKNIVNYRVNWDTEIPENYITIQRYGNTNTFFLAESNLMMIPDDDRFDDVSASREESIPKFIEFIKKANIKNPKIEIIPERFVEYSEKRNINEYGLLYTSNNDIYKNIDDEEIKKHINDIHTLIEKKQKNRYFSYDDIDDLLFFFKIMKHNHDKFRIFAGDNYHEIYDFIINELKEKGRIKSTNEMRQLKEEISTLDSLSFKNEIEKLGGKIYGVGGAVRDEFLGRESKDLDVLITGVSFDDLENILSNYGRVDAVGKSFGVLKFKSIDSNEEIDIAIPRTEKVTDAGGHKGFDVTSDHELPIEKDLERRDFTINAIAKDSEGNIIDPYNGQEDLENKIIRIVNPEAFADDPLRMLRAVQFASRFGFEIEPKTMALIKNNVNKVNEIAPERILIEIDKIVKKGNKLIGAQLLKDTGLFKEIFGFDLKQSTINRSPFDYVNTMGEYIYLLTRLLRNPAEYYKNNLKGNTETYKEIKALDIGFNAISESKIFSRSIAHNMYIISPYSLKSEILPKNIKNACNELLDNKYPKTITELQINGNDLMKIGLNGKDIGSTLKTLLLKIYADKINNNKNELILTVNEIRNEEK